MRNVLRTKWTLPVFSAIAGAAYLVAFSIGGQPATGAILAGVMVLFGAAVLAAGRSETVRGLRGDGRDERFEMLDLRATAFAGVVVMLAIIVAFMVEIARGHRGERTRGWGGCRRRDVRHRGRLSADSRPTDARART